jgi:hypothetical protein
MGGGAKAKIKIEQGKQKKKVDRAYQRYSVRVAPKFEK